MSFCVYLCVCGFEMFLVLTLQELTKYGGLIIFGSLAFEITLYKLCDPMLQGHERIDKSE